MSLARFTDKELDASGLYYFNARYYDPSIQRFVTEDTANFGTGWYSYCQNDPVNETDIDGELPPTTVLYRVQFLFPATSFQDLKNQINNNLAKGLPILANVGKGINWNFQKSTITGTLLSAGGMNPEVATFPFEGNSRNPNSPRVIQVAEVPNVTLGKMMSGDKTRGMSGAISLSTDVGVPEFDAATNKLIYRVGGKNIVVPVTSMGPDFSSVIGDLTDEEVEVIMKQGLKYGSMQRDESLKKTVESEKKINEDLKKARIRPLPKGILGLPGAASSTKQGKVDEDEDGY